MQVSNILKAVSYFPLLKDQQQAPYTLMVTQPCFEMLGVQSLVLQFGTRSLYVD